MGCRDGQIDSFLDADLPTLPQKVMPSLRSGDRGKLDRLRIAQPGAMHRGEPKTGSVSGLRKTKDTSYLMNNRQQSGRRRGRGGQRPQGGQGRLDQGNRIDNRARGNASQLLEKYKTLARDAQLQGDRVMTEYYLQFADHYFRVLSENRARFEENQPQQQRRPGNDFQDYDDDGDTLAAEAGSEADDGEQQPRGDRQREEPRRDRARRDDRERRPRAEPVEIEAEAEAAEEAPERRPARGLRPRRDEGERRPRSEPAEVQAETVAEIPEVREERRPARGLKPRRNGAANGHAVVEGGAIDADRLPPSFNFGTEESAPAPAPEAAAEDAAPAPKRRGRPRKVVEAPAES